MFEALIDHRRCTQCGAMRRSLQLSDAGLLCDACVSFGIKRLARVTIAGRQFTPWLSNGRWGIDTTDPIAGLVADVAFRAVTDRRPFAGLEARMARGESSGHPEARDVTFYPWDDCNGIFAPPPDSWLSQDERARWWIVSDDYCPRFSSPDSVLTDEVVMSELMAGLRTLLGDIVPAPWLFRTYGIAGHPAPRERALVKKVDALWRGVVEDRPASLDDPNWPEWLERRREADSVLDSAGMCPWIHPEAKMAALADWGLYDLQQLLAALLLTDSYVMGAERRQLSPPGLYSQLWSVAPDVFIHGSPDVVGLVALEHAVSKENRRVWGRTDATVAGQTWQCVWLRHQEGKRVIYAVTRAA